MKTYASFYDIVQGVKQETGYTNLANRYPEIISMIVRAERDINPYAGHFIMKRMRYTVGKGCFNGRNIMLPSDFIRSEGLYDHCGHELQTVDSTNHIMICNGQKNNNVVLRYWASQCDPEGHPLVPYTHYEAVVAFIVWKMYSARAFQDKGAANNKREYMDIYERFCKAARGFDFFPSMKNMESMHQSGLKSRLEDILCDDASFSTCCIETYDVGCENDGMQIWFWQEDSLTQTTDPDLVDDTFLSNKETIIPSAFKAGIYFTTTSVGRYAIAIKGGIETPESIVDVLGASIEDSVNYTYYPDQKLLVIISKNYITPGTFYLKLS